MKVQRRGIATTDEDAEEGGNNGHTLPRVVRRGNCRGPWACEQAQFIEEKSHRLATVARSAVEGTNARGALVLSLRWLVNSESPHQDILWNSRFALQQYIYRFLLITVSAILRSSRWFSMISIGLNRSFFLRRAISSQVSDFARSDTGVRSALFSSFGAYDSAITNCSVLICFSISTTSSSDSVDRFRNRALSSSWFQHIFTLFFLRTYFA